MKNLQLSEVPVAKPQMLIRKPPAEVYEAFINPEITTKFWFTKSTGRLEPGKHVTWTWEMYDHSVEVNEKGGRGKSAHPHRVGRPRVDDDRRMALRSL